MTRRPTADSIFTSTLTRNSYANQTRGRCFIEYPAIPCANTVSMRRIEDPQPPGNVSVSFALLCFISHTLEEKTQVGRVDFEVLIVSIAQQFAVAEGIGPVRSAVAHIDRTGERFFLRRRQWFPVAVQPLGQVGFVVATTVVQRFDDSEKPVQAFEAVGVTGFENISMQDDRRLAPASGEVSERGFRPPHPPVVGGEEEVGAGGV